MNPLIIEAHAFAKHAGILTAMFQLRTRVFHEQLKWEVDVADGLERDKYDDLGPVYVIVVDESGVKVKGSLRLLPTTGPTLLYDTFADTIPDPALLSAPTIWECTRLCVDDRLGDPLRTCGELMAALGELALSKGIETNPRELLAGDAAHLRSDRSRGRGLG